MHFDLQGRPLPSKTPTETVEFDTLETEAVETEAVEESPVSPRIDIELVTAAADPNGETRGWNCFSGLVISVVCHLWIMVALSGYMTGPTSDFDRGPAQITVDSRFINADEPRAPQVLAVAELQAFIDETVGANQTTADDAQASQSVAAVDEKEQDAEDAPQNLVADAGAAKIVELEAVDEPPVAELATDSTPQFDDTAVAVATAEQVEQPAIPQPVIPQSATQVKPPLMAKTIPVSTTIQAKYSIASIVKPGSRILSGRRGSKVDLATKLATCESCTYQKLGTKIQWAESADAAAKPAVEQQKLVFLIQVSGNFAREEFT